MSGGGLADATVNSASIKLGLKLIRVPKGVLRILSGADTINTINSSDKNSIPFSMPKMSTTQDEENFYRQYPSLRSTVEAIRTGNSSDNLSNNGISVPVVVRRGSSDNLILNPPASWGDVRLLNPRLFLDFYDLGDRVGASFGIV